MSDQPLTFKELRDKDVARCVTFGNQLHEWSEAEWACAAAGEVGELCNLIKKRFRAGVGNALRHKHYPSPQEVADEAADTIIYLDLLLARMDLDLGEAVRRKFNEVSDRAGINIKL